MQTRDHKMLAELFADEMGQDIPELYKKALVLGSVEPDVNPFTYLHGFAKGERFHGHNYENILSVMRRLFHSVQKERGFGVRKYYRLGKLMHYVADVFTFPHNKEFCGDLKEHCGYESALHDRFRDHLQEQSAAGMAEEGIGSFYRLEVLHGEYLKEAGNCDIDCRYILRAAAMLIGEQKRAVWYPGLIRAKRSAG